MKALTTGLLIFSWAIAARGEVYPMDRKGDAAVEVKKSGDEYRVVCRFRPQTRFDEAVNARFNDMKGDSLCKQGLARYLKVAADETLVISGQYAAAPVEVTDGRMCYSFGVPIAGCKIAQAKGRAGSPAAAEEPTAAVPKTAQAIMNVAPARKPRDDMQEPPALSRSAPVARSASSYVCFTRYREVNGERTIVSRREYDGRNFKSPKEFERFCQQEFARIRALGEANLRAVRNF
ncbi:MAG: hypothetical protein ACI4RD_07415 [Kiritimatiellia bacterium]